MIADLITEFSSYSLENKLEYLKTISDEDLKSLSDWFDNIKTHDSRIDFYFGMISNEVDRRKREKRADKLNDLGL